MKIEFLCEILQVVVREKKQKMFFFLDFPLLLHYIKAWCSLCISFLFFYYKVRSLWKVISIFCTIYLVQNIITKAWHYVCEGEKLSLKNRSQMWPSFLDIISMVGQWKGFLIIFQQGRRCLLLWLWIQTSDTSTSLINVYMLYEVAICDSRSKIIVLKVDNVSLGIFF